MQAPIGLRFGDGRKRRTLHANVCAAAMHLDSCSLARRRKMRRERPASRLVESDVRDDSAGEKGGGPAARAIEELIGYQKIERWQIVAQRSHGAYGNNSLGPQHFQRANIRPVIDLARREAVAPAMTRKK